MKLTRNSLWPFVLTFRTLRLRIGDNFILENGFLTLLLIFLVLRSSQLHLGSDVSARHPG